MEIPQSARDVLESDALAHLDLPPGYITRITATRISGVGPWAEAGQR